MSITKTISISATLLAAAAIRADIIPGLESYGDLTLVDEVACATDGDHSFHEFSDGASYATNILGSACRVLEHPASSAGWMSWTLGRGKGLEAHAMYLLVAEYPEDVPRTGTLMNRAMRSFNGFHTGMSVGNSMNGGVLPQVECESMDVPLSGAWERLEQVMVLNDRIANYDDSATVDPVQDGFDVVFSVFRRNGAPDSAGVALRALRLYRMNDEAGYSPAVAAPDARRYITWRDEMGKHAAYSLNADRYENARIEARLMRALGINCFSYDMLEFGYNQYWDVSYANRGSWFNGTADYWTTQVGIFGDAGISLLPYYEYSGSRGPTGLGVNSARRCIPLLYDERCAAGGEGEAVYWSKNSSGVKTYHFNIFVQNNGNPGKCGANVDLTDSAANEDFAAILDCTILRYKDKANFVGAWIRQRGNMPMSFSDNALARFNNDTGRTAAGNPATRQDIQTNYDDRRLFSLNEWPELYNEYRAWWYGKRRDFLVDMQDHLADGGLPGAKVFFSGIACEPGPIGRAGTYYNELFTKTAVQDGTAWSALSGVTANKETIGAMAGYYQSYFLDRDEWTYYPFENTHSAPKNDPLTYTNVGNVAIAYPYNTVYSTLAKSGPADVAPKAAQSYRNASGDLFFTRHYSLHEGMGNERANKKNYFSSDMDYVGRAIVLPELWALAVQDPTIIGFLQGSRLARNSTKEFKDFAEHFTTLPAVEGKVLWGGGWGDKPYTIRKYKTDAATYYAIVNTSPQSFDNSFKYLSDESGTFTLYDTVTGEQTTLGNGYARFTLEPYQLKVYSTKAPDTPRFSIAVPSAGSASARIPLAVTTLGGDSASLSVSVSTSRDMSGATELPVSALSSAGTNWVEISGLSPDTTYYAAFGLTNTFGKGASRVLSFSTDVAGEFPRASDLAATTIPNGAEISFSLDRLGDGASSCRIYAVLTPEAPGLAVRAAEPFDVGAPGPVAVSLSKLSSEALYHVAVTVTNDLGVGYALPATTITTPARPAAASGTSAWKPGLVQHKYGCTSNAYPDFTVGAYGQDDADRTLGTIMADVTGNPGPTVVNEVSGKSYQWANNTTFVYEGRMFFRGGVAYNFFHCVDDGVAIELDGESFTKLASKSTSGYDKITLASKTYVESGWHDIRVWIYDWSGSKGYGNKAASVGTGLGWNTNGCTTVDSANATMWSPLRDSGDGLLLRVNDGESYLSACGAPRRHGNSLLIPLRVWSYDEDDILEIYYGHSLPDLAENPGAWEHSTIVPAPFPGEATIDAAIKDAPLVAGEPIYAMARLHNARLGSDSWCPPVSYTPSDVLVAIGEATASVSAEGDTATLSATVLLADADASATLFVNGVAVTNWTAVTAGEVLTAIVPSKVGRTDCYSFVISADGYGSSASADGSFLGRRIVQWFDVALDATAYADWPFTATGGLDPIDGGRWLIDGAENSSRFALDNGRPAIMLNAGEGGAVRYAPSSPSPNAMHARASGRTFISEYMELHDEPESGILAAFALVHGGAGGQMHAWTGDGWLPVGEPVFPPEGWVSWEVDFNFDDRSIEYSFGDPPVPLAHDGETRLPMAGSAKCVTGLAWSGYGTIGDFSGILFDESGESNAELQAFDARIGGGAAPALSFVSAGTDAEAFEISLSGATPGRWYAAFASETLSPDMSDWTCVSCVQAEGAEVSLPAETGGRASCFFRVFAASGPIGLGTPLSDLLE